MTEQTSINPKRTISELKELRALTGDANGAQRVAWTDTWLRRDGRWQIIAVQDMVLQQGK